jgi:hypothetical protein
MTALHFLVFANDAEQLEKRILEEDASVKVNGLTALDVAVMLDRSECVSVLLQRASCLGHNSAGWSPFNEVFIFYGRWVQLLNKATSVGNRQVMQMIYARRRTELAGWFNSKGRKLLDKISSDLQDFELEMKWYIYFIEGRSSQ